MFSEDMKKRIEYAFDFDLNWRETAVPLITQEEIDQYKLYRPGVHYGILDLEKGKQNAIEKASRSQESGFIEDTETIPTDILTTKNWDNEAEKIWQEENLKQEAKVREKQMLAKEFTDEQEEYLLAELQEYNKVMMPTLVMQYWGYTDPEKYKKEMLED